MEDVCEKTLRELNNGQAIPPNISHLYSVETVIQYPKKKLQSPGRTCNDPECLSRHT